MFSQFSGFDGTINVRRFYFDVLTMFLLEIDQEVNRRISVILDTRRRSY